MKKIALASFLFLVLPNISFGALLIDNTTNSLDSRPELWGVPSGACGDCAVKGAQSFSYSTGISLNTIRLRHSKESSPTDNIVVSIQADSGGVPSGTDIVSSTYPGTSLPGSNGIVTVDYSLSTTLTASTTYWIVWQRSGSLDGTNYYRTYGLSTGGVQTPLAYNASWATYNGGGNISSFYFQVYGTEISPTSTPSTVAQSTKELTFLIFVSFVFFLAMYLSYRILS